eukprot:jgi/Tetstr1/429143/TSEL_019104.t1
MSIAFRLLLPFIPPGEHAAFARSQQHGSLPSPPPRSPADPLLDAVPLVSASWDSGQRIYADPHARRRPRLGIFRLGAQEARKMPCSMGPRARKSTPRARLLGRSRRRALGEDSVAVFSGSCPIFTGSCHNVAGATSMTAAIVAASTPEGGGATEERHEAPRLPAAIEFPGTGKHGCGFAPAEPRRLNQLYAAIRLAVGGELPPTLKCMAKSRRGDADALATWIEVVLLKSEGRLLAWQKCLMRGAGNCGRGAPRG